MSINTLHKGDDDDDDNNNNNNNNNNNHFYIFIYVYYLYNQLNLVYTYLKEIGMGCSDLDWNQVVPHRFQ